MVSKTYIYLLYLYDIEHSLVFRGLNHIRIYIYIVVVQSADMHVSAFYASSVQLGLGQSALTTTTEVSFALSLVDTHELCRVLNNTEVKERNSTICRHACFGVLRLVSAAWYMLERDVHRTYTHESALTRRMWYSTVTPTDPDMRRVSWHSDTNRSRHAQSVNEDQNGYNFGVGIRRALDTI